MSPDEWESCYNKLFTKYEQAQAEIEKLKLEIDRCKEIAEQDGKEYADLLQENKKLKKQNEIMQGALEFYGNLNTYYINGSTDMRNHIQDGDLEHVLYHYMNYENLEWIGGKKAREALKKVEVME